MKEDYKPRWNSHLEARPDKQFLLLILAAMFGIAIGVVWFNS